MATDPRSPVPLRRYRLELNNGVDNALGLGNATQEDPFVVSGRHLSLHHFLWCYVFTFVYAPCPSPPPYHLMDGPLPYSLGLDYRLS